MLLYQKMCKLKIKERKIKKRRAKRVIMNLYKWDKNQLYRHQTKKCLSETVGTRNTSERLAT